MVTVAFYLSGWVHYGCMLHWCTMAKVHMFPVLRYNAALFNPLSLQSGEVGDLSFNAGEVILVVKKEGDWWHGIINQTSGIFPSNYVELLPNQVRWTDCLCGFIGG